MRGRNRSQTVISPEGSSGEALKSLHQDADIIGIITALQAHFLPEDMHYAERLLMSQAMVLNSIFTQHTSRMMATNDLDAAEYYSSIALRAQNQCQRTLKTLFEFKNPDRATFIREQINTLNQQINNPANAEPSGKNVNPANELLEVNHEARLDTGAPTEAVRSDTTVETVEKINRPED